MILVDVIGLMRMVTDEQLLCSLGTKLAHVSLAGPVFGHIPKLTQSGSDGGNLLYSVSQLAQQAPVTQPSYLYFLCQGVVRQKKLHY